jgi:hypothetical protein
MTRYHLVSLPELASDERLEALNELVNGDREFEEFFRAISTRSN